MTGRVHIVGAGPGDPELLTTKAARLLGEADVVVHDALVTPGILALATRARLVDVGKRANRPSTSQRLIDRILVTAARRYARVVRLKGGDPGVFGRLDEEMDALRAAGIAFEIVPGVTAACAAAASLQVSLTRRGRVRGVRFLTPRTAAATADADSGESDTLVVYMGGELVVPLARRCIEEGRSPSTPLVLVEAASTASERRWTGTLAEAGELVRALARESAGGPVLAMVGVAAGAAPRADAATDPAIGPTAGIRSATALSAGTERSSAAAPRASRCRA